MAAARWSRISFSSACSCAFLTNTPMLDDVRKNVRRAALALVACFGLIAIALGYWQVWRAADLGQDPANPRIADERVSQPRGRILDRNGQVLARSESTPQGTRRQYADPSMV